MVSGDGPTVGRATLLSISRQAGVSTSTVSRALRGDHRISDATRIEIETIARRAGYAPNAAARSLATRRSGVIGLVLGDLHNPFYPQLLEALALHLTRRRLRLMLLHVGAGPLLDTDIEAVLQAQMDGCIISSAQLSSLAAEACARHRVPMVMMNRVARQHGCVVSCDNVGGGRMIAGLLASSGYRRVAVVRGTPNTSTSEEREAGFRDGCVIAGLEFVTAVDGLSSYAGGFEATGALMLAKPRPEAVFAVNDIMAMGVIDALRQASIRVPDDMAVVGFDDVRAASLPPYELTTVAQPLNAMVERAVDLLLARVDDLSLPSEQVFIEGELRLRRSHRATPAVATPAR